MIPNIIHYVWIDKSDNEYGQLPFVYELCLASCVLTNRDKFKIILHSNKPMKYRFMQEQDNSQLVNQLIDPDILQKIEDLGIKGITHKSDFIRYTLLSNVGGIYIDTDVLVTKDLSDLLEYDFVMAKQSSKMYCSGVIMSQAGNSLVTETLQTYYDDYHPDKWAYNAMRVISEKISSHDEAVTLDVDKGFHFPLYTNLSAMYEENPVGFDNVRGHHLWSSSPEGKKLIKYIEENIDNDSENSYILGLARSVMSRYRSEIIGFNE